MFLTSEYELILFFKMKFIIFFSLNMEHPLDISLMELIIQGVRPLLQERTNYLSLYFMKLDFINIRIIKRLNKRFKDLKCSDL